jgi:hypothetical protein
MGVDGSGYKYKQTEEVRGLGAVQLDGASGVA